MIPVSVSDILKLLDQIPIWKAVVGLPKRLAELERRVDEIEKRSGELTKPQVPSARICPICGSTMKVTAEHSHPTFDFAGLKTHAMECPGCGNKATRNYHPGKGYE